MEDWDVVIIGAGAAGLLAAARAAERGRAVLLLEKNRKAGVKILMSGGTRCNITHHTDARGIVAAYGKPGRFLHSALAALGPREVVALFEAEGVGTKVESTGKVFPVSDRALDVRDALVRRLERSGAVLALGEPALSLSRSGEGFEVVTPQRKILARKLLVTSGGKSYPGCGTIGEGYGWATQFGHSIVPPKPALVPIVCPEPWLRALSGITIPKVGVRVIDPALAGGKNRGLLAEYCGSFLFTHFGLSGPAPLNVSRAISGHPRPSSLRLECDFLPDILAAELDARLQRASTGAGKRALASFLEELPQRLTETLTERAGMDPKRRAAELARADRAALVAAAKSLSVAVAGTLGFEKAEVTAGGVALEEVDSRTLESKLAPNLYFAGEVLDLDGPIGGFNFQAAFSTGWLAAENL